MKSYLKKIFIFQSLSEKELSKIEEISSLRNLKKNEEIFFEGDIAKYFYVIQTGKVKIYKLSSTGKEQIIHIQNAGDLIAEGVIFDKKLYPANAMALEKTCLIQIQIDQFIALIHQFPGLSLKLMASYSKRLKQLLTIIEDLSLHDIKKRVGRYLLENSFEREKTSTCSLPIAKKDLASLLGTSPESISRSILSLKENGFILSVDDKNFTLNIKKLQKFIYE